MSKHTTATATQPIDHEERELSRVASEENLPLPLQATAGAGMGKGRAAAGSAPAYRDGNGAAGGGAGAGTTGLITVQPLRKQEMQNSYAQDLGSGSVQHGAYGSMMSALGSCIGLCGAIPCCPFPNPFKSVQQGSVGLVSRFGQFYKSVDPGLVYINVCVEDLRTVDVRIQMSPVPSQTVQTRDNVTVSIDSVICWHVVSPYRAAYGISGLQNSLIERAQTTLRQVVGGKVLQSVISDREALAAEITEILEQVADKWGVAVESVLLKDISFSAELQQQLSSAATQKRIGESKVIAAKAEVDAAKLMRQAADILSSPAAMQIRSLESMQNMARTANTKVIFVPMNLSGFDSSSTTHPSHAAMNASVMREHPELKLGNQASTSGTEFVTEGMGASIGPVGNQATMLSAASQM